MVRAPAILSQTAHQIINDVFRTYQLAFRQSPTATLSTSNVCAAWFRGPGATGQIRLAVADGVLAATGTPEDKRKDLMNELTNMVAGCLESEFLRRGVAIQYNAPRPVSEADLDSFERGTDGIVCFFEGAVGRVALGIELNLAPGVILESSPTRRLPKGPPKLNLPAESPRSGSILVVDDSSNARANLSAALTAAGFDVLQAESGIAALELLQKRCDIAMIFTDLHMTGMHGADLVRMLKANHKLAHIPVIVLTASPSALVSVDTKQIVTCLLKPVSPAAVISLTHRILARAS